jgi:hypothetical protein
MSPFSRLHAKNKKLIFKNIIVKEKTTESKKQKVPVL